MQNIKTNDFITESEYLSGELVSKLKHELVDGQVYAMAGASVNHGRISANISRKLGNQLEGTSCEPFISDMKVKTSTGSYRYPDVLVVCDDNFVANGYATETPVIIVEVLSRSTRQTDIQDKLMEYINIPTLQEYVIVEQDVADVTVYRKSDDWRSKHYFLKQDVYFESIDMTLSVEDIYDRVENEDVSDFLLSQKEEQQEPRT